jgi:hypothetical protein
MYILLAISIFCFFALLLATLAVTRHLRSRRILASPQPDFAQHLFAAAKDQDSRTPRTLTQQKVKDVVATTSWNSALEPTPANTRNQSISSKRL